MLNARTLALVLLATCMGCTGVRPPAGPASALVRRAPANYVFYDVSGDTPAAVWASMREGSIRTLGGHHFARTEWNVTWRARWGGAGTCRVSSTDVQLTAQVTLPRWTPPVNAPPELVAAWATFMHSLSLHEARHVDIAARAARDLRREVEAVTGAGCAGMDARTRTAAERVLTAQREQSRQYDLRTRHGATEGAVWPPRPADPPSAHR